MRIRILRSALVASATLMATMGFAGAATAQPAVDVPDINIGNDACVLPWYWQGPFNVVTEDETGMYEACTGQAATEAEGINIVNNLCAAPWLWQGPVNLLTADQQAVYEACNTTAADEEPPGDKLAVDVPDINIGNDACVMPWYWQGPFNVVTEDETGMYEACTGQAATEAEGINIVNNLCAAPWLWQGPVNLLTADQQAVYEACNTTAADEEPPGDEPPGDDPPGDEPPGDEPPGDDPPGDEPPGDDPPGDEPRIELSVLEPICDGDVPYLRYSIDASSFDPTQARIVWINPDGSDVVYEDLPLSGRVLWPGAEVDEDGNPLDWPGWTQEADGTWVEGDEFDWVRPSVQVRFEVNPEETVTVDYPPATPQCATNPPGTDQPGGLPDTGVPLAGLAIAAGLSAAGGGMLGLRKLLNR